MTQTLQYKGYDGSVECGVEDRLLHGSLRGTRDGVVYEGSDVDSLESNFRFAVGECFVFCAEEGKTPDRSPE
jgi:predicted HicB family RNase H-like nuclease